MSAARDLQRTMEPRVIAGTDSAAGASESVTISAEVASETLLKQKRRLESTGTRAKEIADYLVYKVGASALCS